MGVRDRLRDSAAGSEGTRERALAWEATPRVETGTRHIVQIERVARARARAEAWPAHPGPRRVRRMNTEMKRS